MPNSMQRARTFLATVVPLPNAVDAAGETTDVQAINSESSAAKADASPRSPRPTPLTDDTTSPQTVRSFVTVFFDENAVGSTSLGSQGGVGGSASGTAATYSKAGLGIKPSRSGNTPGVQNVDEVGVGRHFLFFSHFYRSNPDGEGTVVDMEMEEKFARQKFLHFRTAFMSGALIMGIGTLALAIKAIIEENVVRSVILAVGIFPVYLIIGLWVLKRKNQYLKASGTSKELVLAWCLALQSLLIVFAEWVRQDVDYGTLIMHMGFVFNFSPLSVGAMLWVTVVFGMAPYTMLLLLYMSADVSYGKLVWGLSAWYEEQQQGCLREHSALHFETQQRIIVPAFILILQALVTRRRDESLRVDALTKENLRTQKRLLDGEKRKNEGLLKSMLPWKIIEALKANEPIKPQLFADVTVVFIEICNFHQICQELEPDDVMEVLNVIYHEFDRLSDILAVYKVETVMQVYMAVVGCPEPVVNHADVAAHFALAAQRSMSHLRHRIDRNIRATALQQLAPGGGGSLDLAIRVGLNSGPLRAGVVGMESPRYKLVGDAVNTASRMESTCEPGKIQVSESTQQRLSNEMFVLEDRGEISVKGKGKMQTAYLLGYAGDDGSYDRHRVLIEQHRKPQVSMEALASPNASYRGGMLQAPPGDRHTERSMSRCSSTLSEAGWRSEGDAMDCELSSMNVEDAGHEGVQHTHSGQPESKASSSFLSGRSKSKDPDTSELTPGLVVPMNSPSSMSSRSMMTSRAAGADPASQGAQEAPEPAGAKQESTAALTPGSMAPVAPVSTINHKLSAVLSLPTSSSFGRRNFESGLVSIVGAALGREGGVNNEEIFHLPTYYSRATIFSGTRHRALKCWEWLNMRLLLVPPSQKMQSWMEELARDRPEYFAQVMPSRISLARKITTYLLFIFAGLSVLDHWVWFDMVGDAQNLRWITLVRNVGNNLVAIAYLVLMNNESMFSTRCKQYLTVAMGTMQCAALMVCCIGIYRNEPVTLATVVSFCVVSLFYTVCTILQRLTICSFAISVYVVARAVTCTKRGGSGAVVDSVVNIGFLVIFVGFMACGVRLQEHLAHVAHYEQRRAKQRLQHIRQAKAAGTHLLNSLLPLHVISLVCEGVSPIAEYHSDITIIFTDIKGFTAFSSRISPYELFTVLNSMFSAFDEIILNWGLHKVEIIGDAYFISAGCPAPVEEQIEPSEYAMRAVEVGLALQRSLPSVCDDPNVKMRVGMHTGSVVAGVVGKKGPRFHLFGSAVGYAEKMESNGIPGRVQISDATHTMLVNGGFAYEFEERTLAMDGEDGTETTWLVNKSKSNQAVQIQMQLAQRRHQAMTKTRGSASSSQGSDQPV